MKHISTLVLLGACITVTAQLPDYVPTEGLVTWQSFHGNFQDASGNGNHGSSATSPSFEYDSFWDEEVAFFDDVDDKLVVPAPAQLGVDNQISFAVWVNPTEGTHGQVASMDDGRFSFYLSDLGQNFDAFSSTNWTSGPHNCGLDNAPYPEAAGWQHFAVVIASESLTVFHNGVQFNQIDCGGQTNFDTDIVYGFRHMNSSHDYHWGGHMAHAGVWNRTLSSEEVLQLYLTSLPVQGCLDEVACNFNPEANVDDASCEYGCLNCGPGTVWDESVQLCVVANPSDTDFDSCVGMIDLLDLLSVFGTCNETPWSCGDPLEYQGYDYETVQIGEQCWFAENLRAEDYRNGDVIPAVLNDEEWSSTTSGALAVFGS